MAISSEDLPSASMPEETSQYGEPTDLERQRKAWESAGSGRRGAPRAGAGPAPTAGPPPGGAQPVQPPPQPPQRRPLQPSDVAPGGPIFSQPQMVPNRPWRQELRVWAAHPKAGPLLAALSRRADDEANQRGLPGTQAQGAGQPQPAAGSKPQPAPQPASQPGPPQ